MSDAKTSPAATTDSRVAGSRQHPFKLAIIGGGPSGCSILVRAARIGVLPELCQFSSCDTSSQKVFNSPPISPTSKPGPSASPSSKSGQRVESFPEPNSNEMSEAKAFAGVCLVDSGTLERIGGGRLQDYIINSNTWINKFATNVVEEKPNNLPPESVEKTPFESLSTAPSTKQIADFGNKTGPLRLVGHFLRDVGQRAVEAILSYPTSSKFYGSTKVESLHRIVEDGKFICWKLVLVSVSSSMTSSSTSAKATSGTDSVLKEERQEIYALHVAMSTGGHQKLPNFLNPAYKQKTMLSDTVCTMEGVELLKTKLHRYLRICNGQGISPSGRIVVIGGSHSAFSAAWVCLNLVNEESVLRSTSNNCNNSNNSSNFAVVSTTSLPPISLNAHNQIKFGPSGVCILHRSAIRVFYPSRADADHDHYPESSIVVNRITGNINPFGGLRGDAKELWRAIRTTKEGRVRLVQVKNIPLANSSNNNNNNNNIINSSNSILSSSSTSAGAVTGSTVTNSNNNNGNSASSGSAASALKQSIVDKMLDEAVVIVWAAGYATNLIPMYDFDGRPIHVQVSKGQAEVDEHANLLLSESHHGNRRLVGNSDSFASASPLLPSYSHITTASSTTHASSTDFAGIPIGNIYGSGLGYGLKATLDNGELDGASGRADGVAVYLKRGATLILANVVGNKVYGGLNIHSWDERNQRLKKQQHHHSPLVSLDASSSITTGAAAAGTSNHDNVITTASVKSPVGQQNKSYQTPIRRVSTAMASPSARHHQSGINGNNNNIVNNSTSTGTTSNRTNTASATVVSPVGNSSSSNTARVASSTVGNGTSGNSNSNKRPSSTGRLRSHTNAVASIVQSNTITNNSSDTNKSNQETIISNDNRSRPTAMHQNLVMVDSLDHHTQMTSERQQKNQDCIVSVDHDKKSSSVAGILHQENKLSLIHRVVVHCEENEYQETSIASNSAKCPPFQLDNKSPRSSNSNNQSQIPEVTSFSEPSTPAAATAVMTSTGSFTMSNSSIHSHTTSSTTATAVSDNASTPSRRPITTATSAATTITTATSSSSSSSTSSVSSNGRNNTSHNNKQVGRVLGSAGRSVVTGGGSSSVVSTALQVNNNNNGTHSYNPSKNTNRSILHPTPPSSSSQRHPASQKSVAETLRNSIDASVSSKKKNMPGPLTLAMGSASFNIPVSSSPDRDLQPTHSNSPVLNKRLNPGGKLHQQVGQNQLSSSLK